MAQAYTAKQAWEELGISKSSFYRLVAAEKLRVVRVGKKILVPKWAVEELFKKSLV
jgi:excisionase family DNA binding protein